MFRGFKVFAFGMFVLISNQAIAQITQETGSFMAWVHNHITNDMPLENSGGYVKPSATDLDRFEAIFDLLLVEAYDQVKDSLATYYPSYELVHLTDSTFENFEYYMVRENPVTKGWGTFVYNPNYQRDVMVAAPHPLHDSKTPYESVDLFHFLGARLFVMAGTHRCASSIASSCDGTTTVCSATNSSEPFKISDMAHNDSTVFQRAHVSLYGLSSNAWFLNVHGHADSDCEDVFISNGRDDDSKSSAYALRDSLEAHGVDAAVPGDGSICGLAGTTNTQGRYVNGSSDPCGTSPIANTGRFFHLEQFTSIRASQDKYRTLIEELQELIPRAFNTVTFPEIPYLTINEIHFYPIAPGGDADGNGSVRTISDEFVEIVNRGNETIDLSGWTFADQTKNRHVFPNGTKLVSKQALVIFGGSTLNVDANLNGALIQSATTDTLSLSNSSENLFLYALTGATIYKVNYSSDTLFTGGSLVRNPDITGNFVYHKTLGDSWFSVGTKINGDPFVPYATITNAAGWRMLAAPVDSYPLENLEAFTAIQGIDDNHFANVYTSYDGTDWVKPGSMNESQLAGNGFIVYFFDNALAGSSELPITLRASGTVPTTDVQVNLHANGNKFNLIGNPFDEPIDFSQITVNGGSLTSTVGHIYNPQTGTYTTTTAWGDSVGAWQGMMLENNTATSITIPVASIIADGKFANGDVLKSVANNRVVVELTFKMKKSVDVIEQDKLYIVFDDHANESNDALDAKKLYPLRVADKLFSMNQENETYSQLAFPLSTTNESVIDILESGEFTGEILLETKVVQGSKSIHFELYDYLTDKVFSLENGSMVQFNGNKSGNLLKRKATDVFLDDKGSNRFKLTLNPVSTSVDNLAGIDYQFELSQNFPNPFNPTTEIKYSVKNAGNVRLEVFTLLGQKVATLVDKQQIAGYHTVKFDASHLSSGVYLYRLVSGEQELIKKMMLIK
ncbi:T9SS type A sorting domain-containing protein [bacterium]|nr:MAG: T9SS type A sorting domain-containing protein [bacterium]